MGTGKTVTGKLLAEKLQMDFYDSDELIEKREKKTINAIFAEKGESFFRSIESAVLRDLSLKQNAAVSLGGGAVLNKENINIFRKTSLIINLTAQPETIYQRIKDNSDRPLLNKKNPLQEIQKLLDFRKDFYADADFVFDTDGLTPQATADLIIKTVIKS